MTMTLKEKVKRSPRVFYQTLWKLVREDPRRVIHALKVGAYLLFLTLLYALNPTFRALSQTAILAVMSTIFVLEYTVGATLLKSFGAGVATVLAALLSYPIQIIADTNGYLEKSVFFGLAILFTGAACTFLRFIPRLKKGYDDLILVFLVSFSVVTVSGLRYKDVVRFGLERLCAMVISCASCFVLTFLVFPKWSGDKLHSSIVDNLQRLSRSVQACVTRDAVSDAAFDDAIYKDYSPVLDSHSEEELALHTSWEPRFLRRSRYPSRQYVKVGAAIRRFGYIVAALHGIQTREGCSSHACILLAREVSKALMELADCVSNRRHCSPVILSQNLQNAIQDSALPFSPVASLLIESLAKLINIMEEIEELARVAHFQEYQPREVDEVVLNVSEVEMDPILQTQSDDVVGTLVCLGRATETVKNLEYGQCSKFVSGEQQSRLHHDGYLKEKNRLTRMLDDKIIFEEGVRRFREDRRRAEREERINQIIQVRRQDREIKRKTIFYVRSEEERLKKQREEEEARKREDKRMDIAAIETAKREEAAPLIEAAFQRRLVEEKELHEREQKREIELSRLRHDGYLKEKNRLTRMLDDKIIFEERVRRFREDRRRAEREERINQIIQARRQDREIKRKTIFYVRSEEERLKKQREEEEARKREG